MCIVNFAHAETISYGQNGVPISLDLPIIIAVEKGMFSNRNINIEQEQFGNSATVLASLSTGKIHFTSISMFSVIQAHYNLPVILLGRPITLASASLYSVPNIKKISDLKGKTIAVGGANDSTRIYAEIILQNEGLEPNKDINWFYSSDSALRLSSLESKLLEAAILFPPFNFIANEKKFNKLALTTDIKPIVHKSLAFNADWAHLNPSKVKLISDAIDESILWIYDSNNKDEAIAIMSKVLKISMIESQMSFDWLISQKSFVVDPNIKRDMTEYFVKIGRTWGNIPLDKNIPIEKIVVPTTKIID